MKKIRYNAKVNANANENQNANENADANANANVNQNADQNINPNAYFRPIKLLLAVAFAFTTASADAQGAMIVEDPTQILQNATNHAESFGEMMTQTSVFLEDLNMQYDEWSENVKKYEKLIKMGTTAARKVMVLYKEIDNVYTRLEVFRKSLKKSEYFSASEKIVLYAEAVAACKTLFDNRENILKDARNDADAEGMQDGYSSLASINRLINIVRDVDSRLIKVENRANSIIRTKRTYIERTKAVNRMFGVKY